MLTTLILAAAAAAPASFSPQQDGVVVHGPGLEGLELGGQLRLRTESRDPVVPLEGADRDSNSSARARVHLDATLGDGLQAFVEFQKTVLTQGDQSMDFVRQAYARVEGLPWGVDLQAGRFFMRYGNQRMISDLDWSMISRTWDGVRLSRSGESYKADLFWTEPVEGMAVPAGLEQSFGGGYVEFDVAPVEVDVYALARRDRENTGMDRNDLTLGALVEGGFAERFTWSVEGATQTGDHGTEDAAGSAFAARADAQVTERWQTGLGYELATGDDDPTDGDDEAFDPLFDFGHYYHGTQDIFVWTNLQDVVWRNAIKVDDRWTVYADVHAFAKAEEAGPVPSNLGLASVAGEDDLGTEVDLHAKGKLTERVELWGGVSFFSAGDAIANGDDQVWAFLDLLIWI